MRSPLRIVLAALLVVPLSACLEQPSPVAPTARTDAYASRAATSGSSTSVTSLRLLAIDVSGGDLASPLRFDLVLADGATEQALLLPEGKGYDVSIRGYDGEGNLTHGADTFVEYVAPGESGPLVVELKPIEKGDGGSLVLAIDGQPRLPTGWRVVVESETETIVPGEAIKLHARLVNEDGKPVETKEGTFRWFVDDPRVDHFDPTRPPDGADSWLIPVKDLAPLFERLRIGVVIDGTLGEIAIPIWRDPTFVDVSAGAKVSCAVRARGDVECWGDDSLGMLGDGSSNAIDVQCGNVRPGTQGFFRCVPGPVAGGRRYRAVSVGGTQVCAIEQKSDAVFCWGDNRSGQLGDPSSVGGFVQAPSAAVEGPRGTLAFRSVAAGNTHTCGLTTAGEVWCWGSNAFGQFGPASPGAPGTPVQLTGGGYTSVVAGATFTCVTDAYRSPTCWGTDATKPPSSPLASLGLAGTAHHACGIESGSAQVWCWGWNLGGQLGGGSSGQNTNNAAVAVRTSAGPYLADMVTTGGFHSCAIRSGVASCWGRNDVGQLGGGINSFGNTIWSPVRVSTSSAVTLSFTRITAGATHSCGLANGGIFCWGGNDRGQVGNGSMEPSPGPTSGVPMRVVGS